MINVDILTPIQSSTLDRSSGKTCFMIGARGLSIIWGKAPRYWEWISLPESRFAEVARLLIVWWLDISGRIETTLLSKETTYAAYLVFKLAEGSSGFNRIPVQFHIDFRGQGNGEGARVFLDPPDNAPPLLPQDRGDGWKEIEMGEFFNEHGEDGPVLFRLRECDNRNPKSGLIVEGIEFRPKLGL